jgi:hypothetical protein
MTADEQTRYSIWSRNSADYPDGGSFQRISRVNDWQKLNVSLKWSDMSTWSLTLPWDEFVKRWKVTLPTETLISDGYGLRGVLIFRDGGVWPNVPDEVPPTPPVYDNGNLLLSGVITNAKREYTDYGKTDLVTLTGSQDTWFLTSRKVVPSNDHFFSKAQTPKNYWWINEHASPPETKAMNADWNNGYASYDAKTIESVVRLLVYYAMGAGTPHGIDAELEARELPYFNTGTDYERGDLVSYFTRFESLYDMVKNVINMHVADPNYYSVDIVQVSDTAEDTRLLMRFMEPRDMSTGVVFGTNLKNIKSFEVEEKAPEYTYLWVAGPEWKGVSTAYKATELAAQASIGDFTITVDETSPFKAGAAFILTGLNGSDICQVTIINPFTNIVTFTCPNSPTGLTHDYPINGTVIVPAKDSGSQTSATTFDYKYTTYWGGGTISTYVNAAAHINDTSVTVNDVTGFAVFDVVFLKGTNGTNQFTVTGVDVDNNVLSFSSVQKLTHEYAIGSIVKQLNGSQLKYGHIEGFETFTNSDTDGLAPTLLQIHNDMVALLNKKLREMAYNQAGTVELGPVQTNWFMSKFRLGDLVTVNLSGHKWVDYIREIATEVTENGEVVTPTVCDPAKFRWKGGPTFRIAREYAKLLERARRISWN